MDSNHRTSARFSEVLQAVKASLPPTDPRALSLYQHLRGETADLPEVVEAYDLYRDATHRATMDAFVLAGAMPALVEKVLAVKAPVTEAYCFLFMDTTRFRNRLEMLSYASTYAGDAQSRETIRAAVTVGIDYLLWVYGSPDLQVDARQVIRHTMAESYYRGLVHRGNSLTSDIAREAHRWWGTAVKNAELLERIDPRAEKQAFEEIRIQLEKVDDTYTTETAPVDPSEILH